MQVDDPEKLRKIRSLMLKNLITDTQLIKSIDEVMSSTDTPEGGGDDEGGLDEMGDTQLTPDVAGELGGDTEGDIDLPLPDMGEGDIGEDTGGDTELPDMQETLTEE